MDHSYQSDLPDLCQRSDPISCKDPQTLFFNQALADDLGLEGDFTAPDQRAALWSGNQLSDQMQPIAQAYSGHQFGQFNPQLGDGRALILAEWIDPHGRRVDMALKGSGRTPYSRGGDGRAAVGPMLREVLLSEAMHAMGVPTTRSLAVIATGETVRREQNLPGAVLARVAASHIRIGTFEYPASRQQLESLKRLADYTLNRHFPDLQDSKQPYLELLHVVQARQIARVAQWMSFGFIHGVMNTDNISICGETIDYGPCAFLEHYDPAAVFSSIDRQGRYAYQNQPAIMNWNLARFAETLIPLIHDDQETAIEQATEVIHDFGKQYQAQWLKRMRAKVGLTDDNDVKPGRDAMLINDWLALLKEGQVDFTQAWRYLADAAEGQSDHLLDLFDEKSTVESWLEDWQARCEAEPGSADGVDAHRAAQMGRTNPWIIPRNHHVEDALNAASSDGNLQPFRDLLDAVQHPFEERPEHQRWSEPASLVFTVQHKTFCGT